MNKARIYIDLEHYYTGLTIHEYDGHQPELAVNSTLGLQLLFRNVDNCCVQDWIKPTQYEKNKTSKLRC